MSERKTWREKNAEEKMRHMWSGVVCLTSDTDHCAYDTAKNIIAEMPQVKSCLTILHNDMAETHEHWHAVVELRSNIRNDVLINRFKKVTGNPNPVLTEPATHGKDAAIVYLCHMTRGAIKDKKVQYSPNMLWGFGIDDVQTYFNDCLTRYQTKATDDVTDGNDNKSVRRQKLDYYYDLVKRGILSEFNRTAFMDIHAYDEDKSIVKVAVDYEMERRRLMDHFSHMRIYWFSGPAGTGKTSFARFMATQSGLMSYIDSKRTFADVPYVSGSGKDFLGDYAGQHFVILDDFRPENTACSTLLKLLDPHTRSSVDSRYHNKWMWADYVVITAPQSPEEWWSYHRANGDDFAGAWEQLTRRLNGGHFQFYRKDGKFKKCTYTPTGDLKAIEWGTLPQAYFDWLAAQNAVEAPVDPLEMILAGCMGCDASALEQASAADVLKAADLTPLTPELIEELNAQGVVPFPETEQEA